MPPENGAVPPTRSWGEAVARIARRIEREDYPPGHLARLRRLDADAPDGAAFWQLLAEFVPEAWDDARLQRALAIVVRGMAIALPFHRPPDGERRSLGRALAEAGVSEHRLLRLLRADADRMDAELRQLARLVQGRGDDARFDWGDALRLLLSAGGRGNEVRRRLARDYYGRLFDAKKDHAA